MAAAEMIKLAATMSDVEAVALAVVTLPVELSAFKTQERLGEREYPGWQPVHKVTAPTDDTELQRYGMQAAMVDWLQRKASLKQVTQRLP
jgi:hypothetical protein